jgi:hypothetical protein
MRYGLWLTVEPAVKFRIDKHHVTIPSTPKVCFTELKLSESRSHALRYGRLGIGVKRPYLFARGGRPVAYFGYHDSIHNDQFLTQCAADLNNKMLLNFFKPMNSSPHNLNYDLYSESEWRFLFMEYLLADGRLIDPQNQKNRRHYEYFLTLKHS